MTGSGSPATGIRPRRAGLRGVARSVLARGPRRRGYRPGLLSVVVPMYHVERYVDQCLTSLRDQQYREVEIVVVDDGGTDGSRAIAERHASEDPRVRIIGRPNGGLGSARNTGVEHARGEFLAFVDSDDFVVPGIYQQSLRALRRSGSDLAVVGYNRYRAGRVLPTAPWIAEVHDRERIGVDLDQFPGIMVNAVAWSKVYRRDFYDRAGLHFPEGLVYEDQAHSMRAFARARSFDVLPLEAVRWRDRDDGSSISQRVHLLSNLVDHTLAMASSLEELRAAGKPEAARLRAAQLLDNNMQYFMTPVAVADPDYWRELSRAVTMVRSWLPRERYVRSVGAYKKVVYDLLERDRRHDAVRFLEEVPASLSHHRVAWATSGRAVVDFRYDLEGVDPACYELSGSDARAEAQVRTARWVDTSTLELTGVALLRNLDLSDRPPRTTIRATGPAGDTVGFDTVGVTDPLANVEWGHRYSDYTNAGFVARLDLGSLPDSGEAWIVDAGIAVGDYRGVARVRLSPPARAMVATPRVTAAGVALIVGVAQRGRLNLRSRRFAVMARRVTLEEEHVVLELAGEPIAGIVLAHPGRRGVPVVEAEVTELGQTVCVARVSRSSVASVGVEALVLARLRATGELVAVADARQSRLDTRPGDLRSVRTVRGARGALRLIPPRPDAQVDDITVVGDQLVIDLETHELDRADLAAFLVTADREIGGVIDRDGGPGGGTRVRFDLAATAWGSHEMPLPAGAYGLVVRRCGDRGEEIRPGVRRELADRIPCEFELERSTVRVELDYRDRPLARFVVRPPLDLLERSARGRSILEREAFGVGADEPAVFFQARRGEAVDGDGVAVHRELRRRGASLRLYWSVRDYSVVVPEGGIPVVEGSLEWYRALGSARYHVSDDIATDNVDKPAGQILIQTVSRSLDRRVGDVRRTPQWLSRSSGASLGRRAREWDYLVSPSRSATELLVDGLLAPAGAHPQILEIGRPENDALVADGKDEVRRRTRELLGLEQGHRAVLYAPALREHRSTDPGASRAGSFELDVVLEGLSRDYVLLVRGRLTGAAVAADRRPWADRHVDVSGYPDINDLILASDAVVLDYSWWRLRYALADIPMVFLAPMPTFGLAGDGLLGGDVSAPGPLVATASGLVAALTDLDGVRERYSDARDRLRADDTELDDGYAASRLVDAVFVPRGDAPPAAL